LHFNWRGFIITHAAIVVNDRWLAIISFSGGDIRWMLSKIPLFSLYSYKTSTVAVITIMYILMGWDPYHVANRIRNAERST